MSMDEYKKTRLEQEQIHNKYQKLTYDEYKKLIGIILNFYRLGGGITIKSFKPFANIINHMLFGKWFNKFEEDKEWINFMDELKECALELILHNGVDHRWFRDTILYQNNNNESSKYDLDILSDYCDDELELKVLELMEIVYNKIMEDK